MNFEMTTLAAIAEIVWINLLLSGDNAVVIALACRSLPTEKRAQGVALGAAAAVGLRIAFTVAIAGLLGLPGLKIIGGILLFWVAAQLLVEEQSQGEIAAATDLWRAVRTIALADMVMSLDNVLAIAAAANGSVGLIVFGLLLSVPFIVFGAGTLMTLLDRVPALVWGGAALLGWVSGELIATDPGWKMWLGWSIGPTGLVATELAGAAVVTVVGLLLREKDNKIQKGG